MGQMRFMSPFNVSKLLLVVVDLFLIMTYGILFSTNVLFIVKLEVLRF